MEMNEFEVVKEEKYSDLDFEFLAPESGLIEFATNRINGDLKLISIKFSVIFNGRFTVALKELDYVVINDRDLKGNKVYTPQLRVTDENGVSLDRYVPLAINDSLIFRIEGLVPNSMMSLKVRYATN